MRNGQVYDNKEDLYFACVIPRDLGHHRQAYQIHRRTFNAKKYEQQNFFPKQDDFFSMKGESNEARALNRVHQRRSEGGNGMEANANRKSPRISKASGHPGSNAESPSHLRRSTTAPYTYLLPSHLPSALQVLHGIDSAPCLSKDLVRPVVSPVPAPAQPRTALLSGSCD